MGTQDSKCWWGWGSFVEGVKSERRIFRDDCQIRRAWRGGVCKRRGLFEREILRQGL